MSWWLLWLGAALVAAPAQAQSAAAYKPVCHAVSEPDLDVRELIGQPGRWKCGAETPSNRHPVAWLRFDAGQWRGEAAPLGFVSHITRFERIAVSAYDADGGVRTSAYRPDQVELLDSGPLFTVSLPALSPQTTAVVVRIDGPHNLTVLTEARVASRPHLAGWPASAVAMLAIVTGMLVIPFAFDLSFYSVLRERYLILHAAMVASMIGYLLFSGGLVLAFVKPPIGVVAVAGPLLFVVGAAASARFLSEFLEEEALPAFMRKLLRVAAWWSLLVPGTMSLQLDAMQTFDNAGFFYGFVPVLLVFAATVVTALARGSRAGRLVALAWLPLLLCCVDRLCRGTGIYTGSDAWDRLIFLAFALEVVTVWLAVNERFLAMRQDRDKARLEARLLGELSERDPLTGLMNRRAIQRRFTSLFNGGYRTIGVLDLDNFKNINDRYGHAVGDQVLKACASSLAVMPDVVTVRMGGEEFLLMVRGSAPLERAEAARRSIGASIAAEGLGLEEVVTASMGLLDATHYPSTEPSFEDVYAAADKLLYKAKAGGRNRTAGNADHLSNRPSSVREAA